MSRKHVWKNNIQLAEPRRNCGCNRMIKKHVFEMTIISLAEWRPLARVCALNCFVLHGRRVLGCGVTTGCGGGGGGGCCGVLLLERNARARTREKSYAAAVAPSSGSHWASQRPLWPRARWRCAPTANSHSQRWRCRVDKSRSAHSAQAAPLWPLVIQQNAMRQRDGHFSQLDSGPLEAASESGHAVSISASTWPASRGKNKTALAFH